MTDVPFSDVDATEIAGPDPARLPKASGVRRPVIIGAGVLLIILALCFVLFGGRATPQLGQHTPAQAAESVPQPGMAQDPLRTVQTDYSRLLEKPPQPIPGVTQMPFSVLQPPQQPPPGASLQTAPAPAALPPQRGTEQPKERGVLVVQGGKQRQAQAPVTPASTTAPDAPGATQSRDARRMTQKEGFQAQAALGVPETLQDRLHAPESRYMVLAGDTIPATLLPGIHSDLPNHITAQVSLDVRDSVDGTHVLIPQGSRLFGVYDSVVVHGQDRVLIAWQRLRLPNGESLQLEGAPGVDIAGYAGLKDKVDTHFWAVLKGVLLSSILSIGSRSIAGNTDGDWPTVGQQVANEFSRGVNQAGQRIVDRELSRQPTIKIRPGMRFNVLVHRDMVLRPWDSARGTYAN